MIAARAVTATTPVLDPSVARTLGAAAKKLLLESPPSGDNKIVYLSRNTSATLEGDPLTDGASFMIDIGGDGTQCINLPKEQWEATSVGFRYTDPQLANGPVKIAIVKEFLVKNDSGTTCVAACSSPSGAFMDASLVF
jgi:hypothetical protein